MRLNDDKEQGLRVSLAALKHQHRALTRRMDEVRLLLEGLEADDDADMRRTAAHRALPTPGRAAQERLFGRRQDQVTPPQ